MKAGAEKFITMNDYHWQRYSFMAMKLSYPNVRLNLGRRKYSVPVSDIHARRVHHLYAKMPKLIYFAKKVIGEMLFSTRENFARRKIRFSCFVSQSKWNDTSCVLNTNLGIGSRHNTAWPAFVYT